MQELQRLEKKMLAKYNLLEEYEQQLTFFEMGPQLAGHHYRKLEKSDLNSMAEEITGFSNFLGQDNLGLIERCKKAAERKQHDLEVELQRAHQDLERFDKLTKASFAGNGVPEATYELIRALDLNEDLNKRWGEVLKKQEGIFSSWWSANEINQLREELLKARDARRVVLEQAIKDSDAKKTENESIIRTAEGVAENFHKAAEQLEGFHKRVYTKLEEIEKSREKIPNTQDQQRARAQVVSNPSVTNATSVQTAKRDEVEFYISDMDEKKSDKLGDVKKAMSSLFGFLKKLSGKLLTSIVSVLEGSASRNPSAKSRAEQMRNVDIELQEHQEMSETQSATNRKPSASSAG